MYPNHLKNLIKAGKPAFGVSLQFPSIDIVEMIGILGFDWILLDAEHGSIGHENVRSLINSEPKVNQQSAYIHKRNGNSWKFVEIHRNS